MFHFCLWIAFATGPDILTGPYAMFENKEWKCRASIIHGYTHVVILLTFFNSSHYCSSN